MVIMLLKAFLKNISFQLCWVFVAACGLSLVGVSRGCSLVAVCRLLTVVASLVSENGLYGAQAPVAAVPRLDCTGSVVWMHRLSCSMACGIFPDQGSNPCLLH